MTGALIEGVLRGVLGGRRKRSRNALRFLTGGRTAGPLANASTLLTAAGLAWGIYETLQNRAPAPPPAMGGTVLPPSGPASGSPPPLPGAALPVEPTPDGLRLLRLAISAGYADGELSAKERAALTPYERSADGSAVLQGELAQRRPLEEIVSGVSDQAHRATMYVLAYTILRADERISNTERIYLARLANLLGLDPAVTEALERDTGERIDALGDQGQLGG